MARDVERIGLAAIDTKTKPKAKQGKISHDAAEAGSQKHLRKKEREDDFDKGLDVLEIRMHETEEKVRTAGIRALHAAEQARVTSSAAHRKFLADANGKRQACEREAARARKARDDALAWREVQKELEKKKKQRLNARRRYAAKKQAKIGDDLEFIKRYQRKQDARLTHEWSTKQTVAHVLRVRGALEKRGIMDLPDVPMGMDLHNVDPLGDPRLREHKIELDQFVERRMKQESGYVNAQRSWSSRRSMSTWRRKRRRLKIGRLLAGPLLPQLPLLSRQLPPYSEEQEAQHPTRRRTASTSRTLVSCGLPHRPVRRSTVLLDQLRLQLSHRVWGRLRR